MDGFTWLLFGVYASIDHRDRRIIWQGETALINQNIPIILAGNFNCITDPNEKQGVDHLWMMWDHRSLELSFNFVALGSFG